MRLPDSHLVRIPHEMCLLSIGKTHPTLGAGQPFYIFYYFTKKANACAASSLAFFLFSFQVHEKQALLFITPALLTLDGSVMFNFFFLHSTFFRPWIRCSRLSLTVVSWYQRISALVESEYFTQEAVWALSIYVNKVMGSELSYSSRGQLSLLSRWDRFRVTRKIELIPKQSDAVVSKRFTFISLSRYLFKILIGHVIHVISTSG